MNNNVLTPVFKDDTGDNVESTAGKYYLKKKRQNIMFFMKLRK